MTTVADQRGGTRKPIALWAVPRSLSTAFEQMMRSRGDLVVLSEPFSVSYYFGEGRVSDRYGREEFGRPCDHDTVARGLAQAMETGNVFFKDMAFHLRDWMNRPFLDSLDNTFITRHPRRALPSLRRLLPDFTFEETGYEQQLRLLRLVEKMSGRPPVLLDGDELGREPRRVVESYCDSVGIEFFPGALQWSPGFRQEWERWRPWHREVAESSGFESLRIEDDEGEEVPAGIPPAIYRRCLELYFEIRGAGSVRPL